MPWLGFGAVWYGLVCCLGGELNCVTDIGLLCLAWCLWEGKREEEIERKKGGRGKGKGRGGGCFDFWEWDAGWVVG